MENNLNPYFFRTLQATWGGAKKPGDFGIEIEIEGENLPGGIPGWDVHRDGSLRNGGIEYVLPAPLKRHRVLERMKALQHALAQPDVRPDEHYRASTHIHYNVYGDTFANVLGMIIIFTAIEPVFIRAAAPARDGNLFCLPSYDCGDITNTMQAIITSVAQGGGWPDRGKYSCLNTNTIAPHDRGGHCGSLEWRCFPSTRDPANTDEWCSWIANIGTMARNEKDKTFAAFLNRVLNDPIAVLNHLIPGCPIRGNLARDLIRLGTKGAYEIQRSLELAMTSNGKPKRKKVPRLELREEEV